MKRFHFNSLKSTHVYAKNYCKNLPYPITLITTDFQTNGIGTKNTSWIAPKNSSLLASIIYKTPRREILPLLSKTFSLSIIHSLLPFNLPIQFKYPNDLLINNKKLSGVLTEICHEKTITSFGLNLFPNQF